MAIELNWTVLLNFHYCFFFLVLFFIRLLSVHFFFYMIINFSLSLSTRHNTVTSKLTNDLASSQHKIIPVICMKNDSTFQLAVASHGRHVETSIDVSFRSPLSICLLCCCCCCPNKRGVVKWKNKKCLQHALKVEFIVRSKRVCVIKRL